VTRPRFVVSVVTGNREPTAGTGRPSDGVTVSVLDRAYCYRDVAAFRSEDGGSLYGVKRFGGGGYLGEMHARRLAQELCDRLNAEYDPLDY
jgi:hypothetical protein